MKQYKMTITEKQICILCAALEEYFRLRMGQTTEFCDSLAFQDVDMDPKNPNHEQIFDRAIQRRDHLQEIMRAFFRIAFGPYLKPKTEEMMIAEDIWDTIRVAKGISRYPQALHISSEPLPKIEVMENESKT